MIYEFDRPGNIYSIIFLLNSDTTMKKPGLAENVEINGFKNLFGKTINLQLNKDRLSN